jgi:putative endonuclease
MNSSAFFVIGNMYFIYILYSLKLSKYYIESTKDIQDRLIKHNRSNRGFTSSGKPWSIVYFEQYNTKSEALRRELQLKKWKNKERLLSLINKTGSKHPD